MNSNEQETLRTSRSTTKKKIGGRFHLGSGPKQRRGSKSGSRGCRSGRRSRCGRRRRGTPPPRSPSSSRSEDAAKNLGADDRTHNQPEVATAATHHHSPPVSHEGGGRASTEWKERVESGNPYIKAIESAAISLRARRPERERGAGTRAKKFPLPARARASHPAAAQNCLRAPPRARLQRNRGFLSFP